MKITTVAGAVLSGIVCGLAFRSTTLMATSGDEEAADAVVGWIDNKQTATSAAAQIKCVIRSFIATLLGITTTTCDLFHRSAKLSVLKLIYDIGDDTFEAISRIELNIVT